MKKYLFLTDYQTGLIVKTEILEAENEKNVVLITLTHTKLDFD